MNDPQWPVLIFGAWNLGEVVAETLELTGQPVLGFIDPNPPGHMKTINAFPKNAYAFVAIGDDTLREYVFKCLLAHSRRLRSIYHPSAIVSTSAKLGINTFLGEYSVIRTAATTGNGLLLQSGAVISHHCQVGDFVSIGPNATVASRACIGDRTLVGVGATIKPGVRVGSDCTVGAGAVVVSDIAAKSVVVGNRGFRTTRFPPAMCRWR